ncbi:sensor histidine kinase [Oricola indica]|uniref:sensor histidine kinase n=1 Tax=Oricola indica TaxID=2872591 RepID=UPI001CBF1B4C|nr:HAMP domain-containing sensor histidine kinase [Oricola indica]
MARRSISAGRQTEDGEPEILSFVAERLVGLAAGAAFIIAPVCIALSGFGLPGTYGAAAAIALAHVAIPFLALGWLSISRTPWSAGVFAIACWSALAGTLVAVSPILALANGFVLFLVVGRYVTASRVRLLMASPPTEAEETLPQNTRIELTRRGKIRSATGKRAGLFPVRGQFIDQVHVADRIAFLEAIADVSEKSRMPRSITVRVDLASPGEPQSFSSMRLDLAATGEFVALVLKEEAAEADVADNDAQKRFLATVSHELRTPLNSIIGFSDILRRDMFGPLANDRQREYVNLIHSSGSHLLGVVNTILDVSKISAGTYAIHRETFDLGMVAQECAAMLQPQAAVKGVTLEFDSSGDVAQADADRRAMKQIAINLLSNAIKFTEAGGTVRMTIECDEGGFALRVSDDGIGMSDADLAVIGAPFSQVDNAYTRSCEGTGLGLTVVTGLVQLHGGSLDVKSKAGEGTEVTVFIPVGKECASIDAGDEQVFLDAPGKARRKVNSSAVRLAG